MDQEQIDRGFGNTSTAALIDKRERTHGSFSQTAAVAQELKSSLRHASNTMRPSYVEEGSDQICTKLARAYCGEWDCVEHWDDIAGYAKLVADRLRLAPIRTEVANDR